MKARSICAAIVGIAVMFFGPYVAYASIANTPHDMYYMHKGTDPNICSYCHIPHNAAGDKIWSTFANVSELNNSNYSAIGKLCYTCHDGTVTTRGQSTVFNTSLQQHKVSTGKDCNMCHTVHDNTNGKFLGIAKTQSANTAAPTYCETCHGGAQAVSSLGDHLAGSEHPYKDSANILSQSCNSCHQVHGAASFTTSNLTNPILIQSNTDAAFCATCHADHVQNVKGGNKHPANLSSAGTWGKADCESCHKPHQPTTPGVPAILLNNNVDSGYCAVCHQASGAVKGPDIGAHSHPLGVAFTTIGLTPSANAIDDNGKNGADYPNNTASIACESCHSVHSKGAASPLLRITSAAGALCKNCHTDK